MTSKKITIIGAGLTGSLLSILLIKRGFSISVYEKRADIRKVSAEQGRSINLALSHRGWLALEKAGVSSEVRAQAIPMKGRMIHDAIGKLTFLPYGKKDQAIFSVSRSGLNSLLIELAEQNGVKFYFSHQCDTIDLKEGKATFQKETEGGTALVAVNADLMIGADGAFSVLRQTMQRTTRYNYSQEYIEHGYKELSIPPTKKNDFALFPNALHIWPRGKFMLIALPNLDKSFTCTLFLPYEGENSFEMLTDETKVKEFFQNTFQDALDLMPQLLGDFFKNPVSDLGTIKCFPWSTGDKSLLIGDAAHAIVPFYGQGMNAGFEDCRILTELLDENKGNWAGILENFQNQRKPNADAIAELAVQNFIEMRDSVADPDFIKRKAIEAKLHELYPDLWQPLYTMVTFSDLSYAEALQLGKQQEVIMREVMKGQGKKELDEIDYSRIIKKVEKGRIKKSPCRIYRG